MLLIQVKIFRKKIINCLLTLYNLAKPERNRIKTDWTGFLFSNEDGNFDVERGEEVQSEFQKDEKEKKRENEISFNFVD